MSPKQNTDSQCQYKNARGQRCHMLIDDNHHPPNGAKRPVLCAYHANRLKGGIPVVDPEVLAAELLTDIDSFATADEVNLFLGNLVKQLARKRIARRDAIALAYISQLLLNSLTAMHKEIEAEIQAQNLLSTSRHFLEGFRASQPASPALTKEGPALTPERSVAQPFTNTAASPST